MVSDMRAQITLCVLGAALLCGTPVQAVDWTRSNKTALNLEFEVGRKLREHYRTWVKPGVGLWGDNVTNSYNWYLEAGVRYMF